MNPVTNIEEQRLTITNTQNAAEIPTTTTTTSTTSLESTKDDLIIKRITNLQEQDTDTESEVESYGLEAKFKSAAGQDDMQALDFWKRDFGDLSWRCRWLELQIRDLQYQSYLCDQFYHKLRKSKPKVERVEKTGTRTVLDENDNPIVVDCRGSLRTDGMIVPKKLKRIVRRQPPILRKRQIRKDTETHPLYTLDKQYYRFESNIKQSIIDSNKEAYFNNRPRRPRFKRHDKDNDETYSLYEADTDAEINILTLPEISHNEAQIGMQIDSEKSLKKRREKRLSTSTSSNSNTTSGMATAAAVATTPINKKLEKQKEKERIKEEKKNKRLEKQKEKEREKQQKKLQQQKLKEEKKAAAAAASNATSTTVTPKKKKEKDESPPIIEEEEISDEDFDDDDYSDSFDDELSTSESSSSDSDSGFYNKKRRNGGSTSFDVVLSVGSNFHIPVVQYKEIITPEWREVAASTMAENRPPNLSMPSPLFLADKIPDSLFTAPSEYTLQPIAEQETEKQDNQQKSPQLQLEHDNNNNNNDTHDEESDAKIIRIDEGIIIPNMNQLDNKKTNNSSTNKPKEPQLKFTQIDESYESNDNNKHNLNNNESNNDESSDDEMDEDDTDDEAISKRHAQCEVSERYRFFQLLQSTPVSRRKKVTPEFTLTPEELLPSYKTSKKYIKLLGPTWHGEIRRKKKHHHHHRHHQQHTKEIEDGDGTDDEQEKQHLRRRKISRNKSTSDVHTVTSNNNKNNNSYAPMRTRAFTRQLLQQQQDKNEDQPMAEEESSGSASSGRKLANNRSASTPNLQQTVSKPIPTPVKKGNGRRKRQVQEEHEEEGAEEEHQIATQEDYPLEAQANGNGNAWWYDNSFKWEASVNTNNNDQIVNESQPQQQHEQKQTITKPLLLRLKRVKSETSLNGNGITHTNDGINGNSLHHSDDRMIVDHQPPTTTTSKVEGSKKLPTVHTPKKLPNESLPSTTANGSLLNQHDGHFNGIKDSFVINQIDKATELVNNGSFNENSKYSTNIIDDEKSTPSSTLPTTSIDNKC